MKTFSVALASALWVAASLAAPQAPTQTIYGQCGGRTWDGPTACETGTYCSDRGEWFSQCLKPSVSDSAQSQNINDDSNDSSSGSDPNAGPGGRGRGGGWNGGGGWGGFGNGRRPPWTSTYTAPYVPPTPPPQQPQQPQPPSDDGSGGTVVTRTLTTIFNVGTSSVSAQITYLTTTDAQGPQVTIIRHD